MSFRRSLSAILAMAADLVGVRSCAVCGEELLPGEKGLCIRCLSTMPRTSRQMSAVRYADIFANAVAPQGLTEAWFDYDPSADWAKMIWQAKYYDSPRLANELGYAFGKELTHIYGAVPVDLLLPVPMHWRKRMSRGYNQSVEIAIGISDATGIAVGDNLVAISPHKTQTHKGNQEYTSLNQIRICNHHSQPSFLSSGVYCLSLRKRGQPPLALWFPTLQV